MADEPVRLRTNAATVRTLVPGRKPIDLVAYYPHQIDYYPECELQTKRWFVENVRPDWVMFDVGANIGYYSILFSSLVAGGKIYAFEPTETFSMLKENLAYNGCNNVTALQIAVGMVSGAVVDNVFRIWGAEPERQTYDFLTVDDLVLKLKLTHLDCIKIDVDSFDFEVLMGAEQTLRQFNPWIVVELCHALSRRNQSVTQALDWLARRGYKKAHVVEEDNFVLRRDLGNDDRAGEQDMLLTFEDRPVILPPAWVKEAPIENLFVSEPLMHNQSKLVAANVRERLSVDVSGPRWAYGCSWRRRKRAASIDPPVIVEMKLQVGSAVVGLGCVSEDFTKYVTKEIQVTPGTDLQTVSFCVEDLEGAGHLVLRNVDPAGRGAHVIVHEFRCFTAVENAPY